MATRIATSRAAATGRATAGAAGSGLPRRLRANAVDLALLGVLTMIAVLLVTGLPRFSQHLAVQALRADLDRAPSAARDLELTQPPQQGLPDGRISRGRNALDRFAARLPVELAGALDRAWFAAYLPPTSGLTVVPSGPRAQLGLRSQDGLAKAADLVSGSWPRTGPTGEVQIVLSTQVAQMFALRVGDQLRLGGSGGGYQVRLVGLFTPKADTASFFYEVPSALRVSWPLPEAPFVAAVFTDDAGLSAVPDAELALNLTWRYTFDPVRLSAQSVPSLITAALQTERIRFDEAVAVRFALAALLDRHQRQLRASSALLAVVEIGLLAPLLVAVVLAARLSAERRREEFVLLRARGAGVVALGGYALAESVSTVVPATFVAVALAALVPGSAVGTGAAVFGVCLLAAAAAPVLAGLSIRSPAAGRRDLARSRPSPARLTVELSLVAVAAAGVYLLRLRGLSPQGGVDVYLAAAPVLLAAGVALVALRLLPWPVALVAWLAARGRGVVFFLGLARVARSAAVYGVPLAVLVVALTTGLFTGAVAISIDDARDRAADNEVGADVQLRGGDFARDTVETLAAVPGVDAVVAVALQFDAKLAPSGAGTGSATVPAMVVDGPAYQRLSDRIGAPRRLPEALVRARAGDGPRVPALVSPDVAAEWGPVGSTAVVTLRGRQYEVVVAAVVDGFPGLGAQTRRYVVLPWQAMPAGAVLVANRFLIAGAHADLGALRAAGDVGQLGYIRTELGREPNGLDSPTDLVTWSRYRAGLDRTGANGVLSFTFLVGLLGSTALALVAVGLAVLIGARPRGQALSRLRTMGLGAGAGRRLLIVELAPMVGLAALLGTALGVWLPVLLRPVLDLSTFTADLEPRTRVAPLLVAGVLALVGLALAVAVAVESMVNRRWGLGEALRISEER